MNTTSSEKVNDTYVYYCLSCERELFLKPPYTECPVCGERIIPLNYTRNDFLELSESEKNIVIQSQLIQAKNKKFIPQYSQDNSQNTKNEIINHLKTLDEKKIILGFGAILLFLYILDEIF